MLNSIAGMSWGQENRDHGGKMKKVLFASLAVALLLVAGCVKTVPVTVVNDLDGVNVSAIYIYPTTQISRGEDLQTADLATGSNAVFRFVAGTYNILVIDENNISYTYDNVTVPAEGYTLTVIADDEGWYEGVYHAGTGHYPLVVTNSLEMNDIVEVYASLAADSLWGDDMIAASGYTSVWTGEHITLWVEPGTYDIMAIDDAGYTFTYEDVAVSETAAGSVNVMEEDIDTPRVEGATSIFYGDGDCPITITNSTGGWTIMYAWISPAGSPDESVDVLGADVLAPDGVLTAWFDAGTYDIQIEDEDGDTYTRNGVEVGPDGYDWAVTLDDLD
jgi:hypothetical protein